MSIFSALPLKSFIWSKYWAISYSFKILKGWLIPTTPISTLDGFTSPSSLADFLKAAKLCKISSLSDDSPNCDKWSSRYVLADCDLAPIE